MKYTKMLCDMANELRELGFSVQLDSVGATVNNGLYFETGSVINIYKQAEKVASFKTPKSAIKFIKGGK